MKQSVYRSHKQMTPAAYARWATVFGLLFLVMTAFLYFREEMVTAFDQDFLMWLHEYRTPELTLWAQRLTMLGNPLSLGVLTAVISAVLFLQNEKELAKWYVVLMVVGAHGLNSSAKILLARPRPDQALHLIEQGGYSFPSGHAMGTALLFGGGVFIISRRVRSTSWQYAAGALAAVLVLLVGLTRLYLGVHYPSDILGGFCFGLCWLFLAESMYVKKQRQQPFRL